MAGRPVPRVAPMASEHRLIPKVLHDADYYRRHDRVASARDHAPNVGFCVCGSLDPAALPDVPHRGRSACSEYPDGHVRARGLADRELRDAYRDEST